MMLSKFMPQRGDINMAWRNWRSLFDVEPNEAEAEFDRWLAAHDAEVYQRGREDAAKAMFAEWHTPHEFGVDVLALMYAAARGDGECQHEWDHLKGEKCETCQRCGAARGDGEQA